MPEPRFCGACGGLLQDGEAFCTTCGAPSAAEVASATVPEAAPAPTATPAGGEQILAVVPKLTLVGGFLGLKQKTYTLVITDRRLVFAEFTTERATAMVNAARDGAKADGKGFFGQWGAQLKSTAGYQDVYWQMSPDAALAETPDNWAIERSEYQGAKFRRGASDENTSNPDVLKIKAASGKYKFHISGSLRDLKKTFQEVGLA